MGKRCGAGEQWEVFCDKCHTRAFRIWQGYSDTDFIDVTCLNCGKGTDVLMPSQERVPMFSVIAVSAVFGAILSTIANTL